VEDIERSHPPGRCGEGVATHSYLVGSSVDERSVISTLLKLKRLSKRLRGNGVKISHVKCKMVRKRCVLKANLDSFFNYYSLWSDASHVSRELVSGVNLHLHTSPQETAQTFSLSLSLPRDKPRNLSINGIVQPYQGCADRYSVLGCISRRDIICLPEIYDFPSAGECISEGLSLNQELEGIFEYLTNTPEIGAPQQEDTVAKEPLGKFGGGRKGSQLSDLHDLNRYTFPHRICR
jgi:hypothetical protein